jgi:hypothetical protein
VLPEHIQPAVVSMVLDFIFRDDGHLLDASVMTLMGARSVLEIAIELHLHSLQKRILTEVIS